MINEVDPLTYVLKTLKYYLDHHSELVMKSENKTGAFEIVKVPTWQIRQFIEELEKLKNEL